MSFLIIVLKLKLIHTILYFQKKKLTFHVIILIKSVFNKNESNYYYNIFLEKGLHKLPKNDSNT